MHRRKAVTASLRPGQAFLRGMSGGIDWCRLACKHDRGCHEYPCVHLSWTCLCEPLIHAGTALSSCALHCHGAIIGYCDHQRDHPGSRLQVHFDNASGSCTTIVIIGRPTALAPCWNVQRLWLLLLLLLPMDSFSCRGREGILYTIIAKGHSTHSAESCSTASRTALEVAAAAVNCICLREEWLLLHCATGTFLGALTSRNVEMVWRVFALWQCCLWRNRWQDSRW